MDKSIILSYLANKEFQLVNIGDLEGSSFSFYKKSNINIILCHYIKQTNKEKIEEDAEHLRYIMHKNKFNVWNTYMLVSFNYEIDLQEIVLIERSSKSIRRYVLTQTNDFKRIPFLDNVQIISNPFEFSTQILTEENSQIKKVLEFIKKNGGGSYKIDTTIIQDNINELFDLEG